MRRVAGAVVRCVAFVAVVSGVGAAAQQDESAPSGPSGATFRAFDVEAFVAHVRQRGASESAIAAFRTAVGDDAAAAAESLLRSVDVGYAAAAAVADRGDPTAPTAMRKVVEETSDAFVRGHARYRLARTLLAVGEPEQALAVLREYLAFDRNRTALDAEALLHYGDAAATLGALREAREAYTLLLTKMAAPPRNLVRIAQQRVADVAAREASPLHAVADVMQLAEKRLRRADTGAETQALQAEVLVQLQQILEQVEQQEQQQTGTPGGVAPSSDPAKRSEMPTGAPPAGAQHGEGGAVSRFGDRPQREREAIEAELRQSLPGPYRRLLEDYYRRLGRGR